MEEQHTGSACRACEPVSGVRGDLLMMGRREARCPQAFERGEHGDVGVTTQSEDLLDAALDQEAGDVVGDRGLHRGILIVGIAASSRLPW
jgi:hypothetical protein